MSMIKLITPAAYDFAEPVSQLIKLSSHGLVGEDMRQLVKRAGASVMEQFNKLAFAPGEVPVHVIALGATESTGINRNGDGFKAASCRKYHPTFVKNARWFRHHSNKRKNRSYGIFKASMYNEDMGRIELIAALNGTKEAADRNGGLVADEELEKLANNEAFDVSMAASVPLDVCSSCGHKSASRREYCDESSGCPHGGLKHNIGKVFEDGHHLHADNPDPNWFDLSSVIKRADRIAMVLGRADEKEEALQKAAACQSIIGGAELAERAGVTLPLWMQGEGPWDSPRITGQMKIASRLIDRELTADTAPPSLFQRAFLAEVQPPRTDLPNLRQGPVKLAHLLTALAEVDCLLPPVDFLSLLQGQPVEKVAADAVAARLPGVFSLLAELPDLEHRLQQNPYLPEYLTTESARHWAQKQASTWSLTRPLVVERLQRSVLRQAQDVPLREKQASTAADALAQEYALYQLGFLYAKQGSPDLDYLEELTVAANRAR